MARAAVREPAAAGHDRHGLLGRAAFHDGRLADVGRAGRLDPERMACGLHDLAVRRGPAGRPLRAAPHLLRRQLRQRDGGAGLRALRARPPFRDAAVWPGGVVRGGVVHAGPATAGAQCRARGARPCDGAFHRCIVDGLCGVARGGRGLQPRATLAARPAGGRGLFGGGCLADVAGHAAHAPAFTPHASGPRRHMERLGRHGARQARDGRQLGLCLPLLGADGAVGLATGLPRRLIGRHGRVAGRGHRARGLRAPGERARHASRAARPRTGSAARGS